MSRGCGLPVLEPAQLGRRDQRLGSDVVESAISAQASKLGAEAPPREQRSLGGRHLATLLGGRGPVEATRLLQRPRPPGGTGRPFLNGIDGVNVTARPAVGSHLGSSQQAKPVQSLVNMAVAGRNLDMRDAARNVPSWDRCHETATVRRTNHVRMYFGGGSARMPRRRGTTGMRHDVASHRLAARTPAGGPRRLDRRGRPDRAGGQAGSASAPRTLRRAEGNTHEERYARPPPAQRMVERGYSNRLDDHVSERGRRRRPEPRVDGHRGSRAPVRTNTAIRGGTAAGSATSAPAPAATAPVRARSARME